MTLNQFLIRSAPILEADAAERRFNHTTLVEEYEILARLVSLDNTAQYVERAHMDGGIDDAEYERRKRNVFIQRVQLQTRADELREKIEQHQPRRAPKGAFVSMAHEKELIEEELREARSDEPRRGERSRLASVQQLTEQSGLVARLIDILHEQVRDTRLKIEKSREIEEDVSVTPRRQQEARRLRERLEAALKGHFNDEDNRLHTMQFEIGRQIRERVKRQPLYTPFPEYKYDREALLGKRLAEQQQVDDDDVAESESNSDSLGSASEVDDVGGGASESIV